MDPQSTSYASFFVGEVEIPLSSESEGESSDIELDEAEWLEGTIAPEIPTEQEMEDPDMESGHDQQTDQLSVGKKFKNRQLFVKFIQNYARMNRFNLRVHRNEATKYKAQCSNLETDKHAGRRGKHTKKVEGEEEKKNCDDTPYKPQKCPFLVRASIQKSTGAFVVREVVHGHNAVHCRAKYTGVRSISYSQLGEALAPNLREGMNLSLKAIRNFTFKHYKVSNVSDTKAYRAWVHALERVFGDKINGYLEMESFVKAYAEANPDSVTAFEPKVDNPSGGCWGDSGEPPSQFKRAFFSNPTGCFNFIHMKQILAMDGTHLSGDFKGVILFATASDSNDNLVVLAWAIVDIENADNWEWFCQLLCSAVRNMRTNSKLIILSDRDKGLQRAVLITWRDTAQHSYCLRHIWGNIYLTGCTSEEAKLWVFCAAHAQTKELHDRFIAKLESKPQYRPAVEKLKEIGVSHYAEFWYREQGLQRWGHVTSNLVESMNNIFKDSRAKNIRELVRDVTAHMVEKTAIRHQYATHQIFKGLEHPICTKIRQKVEKNCNIASATCTPTFSDRFNGQVVDENGARFTVQLSVNLNRCSCDCGQFQAKRYPCTHACAIILGNGHDVQYPPLSPFDYVDGFYHFAQYQKQYAGLANHHVSEDLICVNRNILPPPLKSLGKKNKQGRKKKMRFLSKHERGVGAFTGAAFGK